MKQIKVEDIKLKVKDALIKANQVIDCEILNALNKALIEEDSKLAKEVLATIIQNDELAKEKGLPICQDTGLVVAFVKLGYQISLDGNLVDVINEGVKEAYLEGALRKSVVLDPFNRVNTLDNTPAIIHIEMDNSDQLTIDLCPKGAGSENMSTIKMFPPSAGLDGVKEFIMPNALCVFCLPRT